MSIIVGNESLRMCAMYKTLKNADVKAHKPPFATWTLIVIRYSAIMMKSSVGNPRLYVYISMPLFIIFLTID